MSSKCDEIEHGTIEKCCRCVCECRQKLKRKRCHGFGVHQAILYIMVFCLSALYLWEHVQYAPLRSEIEKLKFKMQLAKSDVGGDSGSNEDGGIHLQKEPRQQAILKRGIPSDETAADLNSESKSNWHSILRRIRRQEPNPIEGKPGLRSKRAGKRGGKRKTSIAAAHYDSHYRNHEYSTVINEHGRDDCDKFYVQDRTLSSCDRKYVYWKPSEWMTKNEALKKVNEAHFKMEDGRIKIKQTGLYFIYGQIMSTDGSGAYNTVGIFLNDTALTRCTQSNPNPMPGGTDRYTTCWTGLVWKLERDDEVSIRHFQMQRKIDPRITRSFFGIYKIPGSSKLF